MGFSLDPSQWGNDINGAVKGIGGDAKGVGNWVNSNNFNPFTGNASPTHDTPQMGNNAYGQAYQAGQSIAGVGGTESQGQGNTIGMLGQMAQGNGPNPAQASLNQATAQGQAFAQAQAGGARGNMGLAGAQHTAMQNGANIGQQAAQTGAVLQQQQQFGAINALQQAQTAQRSQDLMAQGMNSQAAQAQAQLEATTNGQNETSMSPLFGGVVAGGAKAVSALGALL
jgi:hypothetical protein